MTASILNGNAVSSSIRARIKTNVHARIQQGYRAPKLAVIILGNDPASHLYVHRKHQACQDANIESVIYSLPTQTTELELLSLIDALNQAKDVDGVLVQLPLPTHINPLSIATRIEPHKDVDGLHPVNLGHLAQGDPRLRPCTPYGIMTLLHAYQQNVTGKHAVVIGASNIVGRPMALELLHAKATVTICHRQTQQLEKHVQMADIVVIATGHYNVVSTKWLRPHQIVIDVGIHRTENKTIHGDVDFNRAKEIVSWITPVPGGVGPMTIAALLQNTWLAATHFSK